MVGRTTVCGVIWLLATFSQTGAQSLASCLPDGASSLPNPPPQPQLPNSFRVQMIQSFQDMVVNGTVEALEVVDTAGNRAKVVQMEGGHQVTLLYSYDTQEIFTINGTGSCIVRNLTSDSDRYIFFGETLVDHRAHMLSGTSSLYFGPTIRKIYLGTEWVRGILCDHWQACIVRNLSQSQIDDTMPIDYFFSVKGWQMPSSFPQVPVRYIVNHTSTDFTGRPLTTSIIYDYVNFIPSVDADSTDFQTPEGVVCKGRQNTKTMPPLIQENHAYHYWQEIIDVYSGTITQAQVWYDLDSKLARVDFRSPDPYQAPLYTSDPISEVHDYNYGVQYVKNKLSGECRPMALNQASFDARINVQAYNVNGTYVMHMKNPLTFFFLDSNFTFTGQRRARDALCDVFISHRFDFDYFNNGSAYEAIVEAYFLVQGWKDIADDSMGKSSQGFPYRVHLKVPKMESEIVYNLFDFDAERPEISVFDVADCFNSSASVKFTVTFQGSYERDTEHMTRLSGQSALASSMQVSPLRVNELQLAYDTNYLYLTATLLHRTPSLAQFTHLPGAVKEKTDDESWSDVESPAACSDLCVNNPDIRCQSFQFCPSDRSACRISSQHISDGAYTVVGGLCDLYSRKQYFDYW